MFQAYPEARPGCFAVRRKAGRRDWQDKIRMMTFNELKRRAKADLSALPAVSFAVTGDNATQLLCTAIRGTAAERGLRAEILESGFDQIEGQLLNPESEILRSGAEFIVLFQSSHKLLEKHACMCPEDRPGLAEERLSFIRGVLAQPGVSGRKLIVFNYPEIDDGVFGSYANKVPECFVRQVRRLNAGLMDLAEENANLFICDLSSIQNKYGRDFLFASNIYATTENVLSLDALPAVASRLLDIVCAVRGMLKKCLILDLDNTLWGGIVGDDGVEGIEIGHGLGTGQIFREIQLWAKKLKDRGILLCVVSKNDEANAKAPFLQHPDMVLRLEDFAVFIANWENKADNIRRLQAVLNISFDSMVFLDDTPFERAMVREHLPAVTVPELPEDPADWLEFLYGLNLFETASFASEDRNRTGQYRAEAGRVSARASFANEDDFLRSLDMTAEVRNFDSYNIPRVAQLSQRSNQFNLRTVRYTEDQIAALAAEPDAWCLAVMLRDRFGDNGLVAAVILKRLDAETCFIDTWIMSCRVLRRGVEDFTLNAVVRTAREAGFTRIMGEYLPTAKNKLVENLFSSLGFSRIPDSDSARYELFIQGFQERKNHIRLAGKNGEKKNDGF